MKSFQYAKTKYMLTVQQTAGVLGVSAYTVYKDVIIALMHQNVFMQRT